MLACIGSLGFFNSAKVGVGWPYLLEMLPFETRAAHAAAFGIQGASLGIIGAVFFLFISQNGYYFMTIGFIFQAITIGLVYMLPESPVYLFFSGRIEEGRESLE